MPADRGSEQRPEVPEPRAETTSSESRPETGQAAEARPRETEMDPRDVYAVILGDPDAADWIAAERREHRARMPRDEFGRPTVDTGEYADWYRSAADTGDAPAPRDRQVEATLPEWSRGAKTEGYLARSDDGESLWGGRIVKSGYDGPAQLFAPHELGMDKRWRILADVETHAAATMRVRADETTDATLYLSRRPCKGRMGCMENLERSLPEGAKLTAYWPDGHRVFIGRPDEPGQRNDAD